MRLFYPGTERYLYEVRHLWRHYRLQLRGRAGKVLVGVSRLLRYLFHAYSFCVIRRLDNKSYMRHTFLSRYARICVKKKALRSYH